jgi:hypothetical protein
MDSQPGDDTTSDIASFDDVRQTAVQTLADMLQSLVEHIAFLAAAMPALLMSRGKARLALPLSHLDFQGASTCETDCQLIDGS